MISSLRRLAALMLALVAVFAVAACGGDDEEAGSAGNAGQQEGGGTAVQTGGQATFNYGSFPDYLDPALSYTVQGWQALVPTYTTLLTYRRERGAAGAQLIPGLAEAIPEATNGGRTYEFTLRDGLTYSNGEPVRARDVEHTIKRVLNLESGGASFYQAIEGADEYLERGRARGDITGIETDDQARTVTFNLTEPNGQFPFILAMPFAGVVPSDTPFENQTANPPPGVGPFMITEVNGTRSFTMEKNPRYPEIPDLPAAKLDRIQIDVVKNQQRSIQDAQRNTVDYVDEPPAGDALRQFRQAAPDRYSAETTNSTYYFFLNHREEPFDDVRVRQAVGYAIDERSLARIFGGLLTPSCNFLPPGMQGYEAIQPCPYGDPRQPPNLDRARQLIQEAGAEGERVNVYGNDEDPSTPVAEYLSETLNSIGLQARPRILDGAVYFQTLGNDETGPQTGFANWFQDFPHPGNFMFLVDPDTNQPTNNQNFSRVEDPEIKTQLDQLNTQDLSEAAAGYAALDRRIVEQAHVIPYGNRQIPFITSNRIARDQALFHPVLQADYTSFALRR
jgi:peptide/nickel transport system substrate-binding protein